ncbi:MAG: hypothetical protein GY760_15630 [Deltaproteobacteria bacterium]|nr:hypothetical protein [Deltaproteobacteria bacterium]
MDNSEANMIFSDYRTEAWAFVTFLMSTDNKEYGRFLWDTITSMKNPDIDIEDINSDLQIGYNEFLEDFLNAQELMELGIEHYNAKDTVLALQTFTKLISISPESWQPLYFLGLMAYDEGDYENADIWYSKASDKKAPESLVAYVTGLTAWKDERIEEALGLLSKAARLDAEKYDEKTAPILEYLQKINPGEAPVSIP